MTLRALVRADPIPVAVGPYRLTIPPFMADEWLSALDGGVLLHVVPDMLDADGQGTVAGALVEGAVSIDQLAAAAKHAIAEAAGRPWYEAIRIASLCGAQHGAMVGVMLIEGVHPGQVTFAGWCAAVMQRLLRGASEADRLKLETDLRLPPDRDFSQLSDFDGVQF